ncbi:MAG: hypothetical protein ABIW76_12885 [Fibrobacteria bacterium]
MKLSKNNNSLKSKTLGLALAAVLIPGGLAMAHDGNRPMVTRGNLSGHVEVVHEIPGGTGVVGAEWGKPRPTVVVQQPPQVVVVQQQPQVVVIEKDRGHGRGYHKNREVTIIREEQRRCARPQVVVVEKHVIRGRGHNHHDAGHGGNSHYYNDGKQVSVDRKDHNGQYHYYKDANQVSETRTDRSGAYHYYEDARQVSIQDNRDGRNRNVYVQK